EDLDQQRQLVQAGGEDEKDDTMMVLAAKVTRSHWHESQVIVIQNGSWLLNYPLVNREHRKLAGRLIAECGAAGTVAFLETGPEDARIARGAKSPFWELLKLPPLGTILMHLMILGLLYCF